jgi:hypothetical protein
MKYIRTKDAVKPKHLEKIRSWVLFDLEFERD